MVRASVTPGPCGITDHAAGQNLVQKRREIVFAERLVERQMQVETRRGEMPTPSRQTDLRNSDDQRGDDVNRIEAQQLLDHRRPFGQPGVELERL